MKYFIIVTLILAFATGCAAQATLDPKSDQTGTVIYFERSGGLAGTLVRLEISGDGRVKHTNGMVTELESARVQELLEKANQAGFFDAQTSIGGALDCKDCFNYVLTISDGSRSNTLKFVDTSEGISDGVWELVSELNKMAEE